MLNNMLNSTLFIIELISNGLFDLNILRLIIPFINYIHSQHFYIIISLSPDINKLTLANMLLNKIKVLSLTDLSLILYCFSNEKYKYHLFIKYIKGCIIDVSDDDIIKHFENLTIISKIKYILHSMRNSISLDEVILNLSNFYIDDRLSILEKSISSNNNIKLNQVELYCEILRDIFKSDYDKSCEILGINPDIYKNI